MKVESYRYSGSPVIKVGDRVRLKIATSWGPANDSIVEVEVLGGDAFSLWGIGDNDSLVSIDQISRLDPDSGEWVDLLIHFQHGLICVDPEFVSPENPPPRYEEWVEHVKSEKAKVKA